MLTSFHEIVNNRPIFTGKTRITDRMATSDKFVEGAKGGAAGVAGAFVGGPTLGPVAAGFAADHFMDGSTRFTEMGTAMSIGLLLAGNMGSGNASANGGVK